MALQFMYIYWCIGVLIFGEEPVSILDELFGTNWLRDEMNVIFAYVVQPTIDIVSDELRYFKYLATFDFECMFNQDHLLQNTEKLSWKNQCQYLFQCSWFHSTLSFVLNGDLHELLKEFIDNLVQISQESYRLLMCDFESLR